MNNYPLQIIHTPLMSTNGNIHLKMECLSPGGSHKFRTAKMIIDDAIQTGKLKKEMRVIDKTGGNYGIGLHLACKVHSIPVDVVIPKGYSIERQRFLKSLGVNVIAEKEISEGVMAREIIENILTNNDHYFYPNQFSNHNNVLAHFLGSGTEILNQMEFKHDKMALVMGAGTGGSLRGVHDRLKESGLDVTVYLTCPEEIDLSDAHKIDQAHNLKGFYVGVKPPFIDTIDYERVEVTHAEVIESYDQFKALYSIDAGLTSAANLAACRHVRSKLDKDIPILSFIYDHGYWYHSRYENMRSKL